MKKFLGLSLFLSFALTGLAQNLVKVRECVIVNGSLKEIEIDYNSQNGERSIVVGGVRKKFYDLYPVQGRDYAAGHAWYINNETVSFNSRPYVKYGLPRVLGITEIEKAGPYKGVGVYTERGHTGIAEVIYIPVRQGCEFQPYQLDCGTVRIEPVDTTAFAMRFTAKTMKLSGKVTYAWEPEDVQIIKGQGTPTITIDTKNKKEGDGFGLKLIATDAKNCPAITADGFTIARPASLQKQPTGKTGWGSAHRKNFMDECVKSSKLGEEKGTAYCSCMMEKIIKQHPDPATVQKDLKQETIMVWAKECLLPNK